MKSILKSDSHWRNACAPIIAKVLASVQDPKELRKALRAAYPFGPRRHHPYKIWLDEIARQTGRKPALGSRRAASGYFITRTQDPRQTTMFVEADA